MHIGNNLVQLFWYTKVALVQIWVILSWDQNLQMLTSGLGAFAIGHRKVIIDVTFSVLSVDTT